MKTINKNHISELKDGQEDNTLLIFCFDSVSVQAKPTFDSLLIHGNQVTYWMDDEDGIDDIKRRINGVFDVLFEEVIKTRKTSQDKTKD